LIKTLANLEEELERSKDIFIKDHLKRYKTDLRFPPAWKTLEIASFGTCRNYTVTSEQRSTLKTGSLLNSKPSTILFCRAGCSRSRKSETFAPIMEGCGIRIYPADHI
jgi:hypothetical protein